MSTARNTHWPGEDVLLECIRYWQARLRMLWWKVKLSPSNTVWVAHLLSQCFHWHLELVRTNAICTACGTLQRMRTRWTGFSNATDDIINCLQERKEWKPQTNIRKKSKRAFVTRHRHLWNTYIKQWKYAWHALNAASILAVNQFTAICQLDETAAHAKIFTTAQQHEHTSLSPGRTTKMPHIIAYCSTNYRCRVSKM